MKIKTANIRMFQTGGGSKLKKVEAREVFTYANELFFIHRISNGVWQISHYQSGFSTGARGKTIAAAKAAFSAIMDQQAENLQRAIGEALKHGVANELPEVKK